jgi:hypothetical protein
MPPLTIGNTKKAVPICPAEPTYLPKIGTSNSPMGITRVD